MKKIEKELVLYYFTPMDYVDFECIMGVSERTYYQYLKELREGRARIEACRQKNYYEYRKSTGKSAGERHTERLCRLMVMMDYIKELPCYPYSVQNVLVEEWEKHIQKVPPRMRQRDFAVLRKIGYEIYQKEKRYFFKMDEESFWKK